MNSERFLTNIISTLATSPDLRTTIDNLAILATDGLADWCGVYIFENDQTIRRLAVSPMQQTEVLFPLVLHATTGPAYVRRTGDAQVLRDFDADVHDGLGIRPEELVLKDGRKLSTYACMPAVARNRMIGAVVFMCAKPKDEFNETELMLAASLANAAAVAMD